MDTVNIELAIDPGQFFVKPLFHTTQVFVDLGKFWYPGSFSFARGQLHELESLENDLIFQFWWVS